MTTSVIIIGGGIAGIACALRLAEAGVRVTLIETRKKLGGRATSFEDVRTGLVIDNCQHVALGCCTNYLDFCRRLGVEEHIRWLREQHWVEAGGRVSTLRPGMFPAPGHFTETFLSASFLTLKEKLAIGMGMTAALAVDRSCWRSKTFADWLAHSRQPISAIEKFWSPVVVSACNLDVARVCAASALHVFQEGFLAHRDAAAIGVSAVPLVRLYDPAERAIEAAGGALRLGCAAGRVWGKRIETTSGEMLEADAVVLAVPPERAARLVDDEVRAADPRFDALARITHSPILGVHMTFDRPVMPLHSAVLVSRETQWLFRKDESGSMLHAVISAADAWVPLTEEEITGKVLADIHACFPLAREARLISSRPVKEKFATFAPTPEVEALRPPAEGPSGIILAGDAVQTGWPGTMEGAARSGYSAAGVILGIEPVRSLVPSLRPSAIARAVMAS